jgi:hypothetical protein
MKRTLPMLLAGAALAGVLTITVPGIALAHARYKSSTPGTSEVVQASPAQVEITFTQHIQKVTGTYDITVDKDRGPSVTSGPAVVDSSDRTKMSVPLQPNLPAGRYVVNYKNVSDDDGDPFAGAFAFYVQTQPTTVDKANDAQLAQIGAPETPGAETTPGAASTPGLTTSVPSVAAATAEPSVAAAQTALPTAVPSTGTDGGGGSNTGRNVGIGVGIAVVVILLAGGGWYAYSRRT